MISRDELLTKLAIECATWDEANSIAVHSKCLKDNQREGFPGFSKEEWLTERERLLNKPEWPDGKEWKWRAMDKGGKWYFYKVEPLEGKIFTIFFSDDNSLLAGTGEACKIPAGYDWRKSLEERTE